VLQLIGFAISFSPPPMLWQAPRTNATPTIAVKANEFFRVEIFSNSILQNFGLQPRFGDRSKPGLTGVCSDVPGPGSW
jgi:hypothetical protein